MTRARRRTKRQGVDLAHVADLFLAGDVQVTWIEQDEWERLDVFTRRALWPQVRQRTWDLWVELHAVRLATLPPAGAVLFDSVGQRTWEARFPVSDAGATPAEVRAQIRRVGSAARSDLSDLAKFRQREPEAAREVAGPVMLHEQALRVVAEIAQSCRTADACREAKQAAFAARKARVGA